MRKTTFSILDFIAKNCPTYDKIALSLQKPYSSKKWIEDAMI